MRQVHAEQRNAEQIAIERSKRDGVFRQAGRFVWSLPRLAFIGFVRVYQIAVSPLLPATCRFQPTCSAYAIEAMRKYGFVVGGFKTAWRLVRCTPLCKGGHDPP